MFFFSSRRRHTRLVSDWSSDVCSSDLIPGKEARQEEVDRIRDEAVAALKERFPEQESYIGKILHDLERDELREMVLTEGVRRSEERRVGKECRYRRAPCQLKQREKVLA